MAHIHRAARPGKIQEVEAEIVRYQAAWENYSIYSGRYWFVLATFIPGVLFFGWLLSFAFDNDLAHGVVAFAWMVLWVIVGKGYREFLCPRCGKKFFVREGDPPLSSNITSKCLNCGLPKYARDSTGASQEDRL